METMITIPFYNHYNEEKSPTAEMFNNVLLQEEIELKERPCLCRRRSGEIVLPDSPRIVLIHGERLNFGREGHCYGSIRKFIEENRDTRFFMFAYGMDPEDGVRRRIGEQPNCTPIYSGNVEECFEEIIRLAKEKIDRA